MTRLIDADVLIKRLKPYINKYGGESFPYDIVHDAFIYEIEHEPTIDAVPIEFIDKRIVELTKLGAHVFTANGGYVSSVDFRRYELEEIIKIWRKEHHLKTDIRSAV